MVECKVTLCYNDETPEALFLEERIGELLRRENMEERAKMESAESRGAAIRLEILIAVLVLIGHAGGGGSSVWAAAGEAVKNIQAVQFNPWQVTSSARNFAEVEIVPGGQLSLAEISTLPRAPGSDVQVLAGPGRVRIQLPAQQVRALVDAGAGVTVLRRFLVFEGSTTGAEIPESDPIPQEACSGDYLYGYSDLDVPIPTDGGWDGSGIALSGVSPDAEVTCVDVHYEINHHYSSALLVELTDEDYDFVHTLYDDYYTGDGDINETEHGITKFNGRNPNQEWVLWVQNGGPVYGGHIDSWWIKVYYYEPFYCSAASANCSYEYISNVQVGDISNATDCNYYGDYTSMSTAMDVGTGYPITVTNGQPYDENDECGIWVDWNQDGDFNDVSEKISVSGSPGEGPYTATITPPPTAANGDTRLRIRISAGPAGPCGEYDYGEVEDYTVTVAGGAMGQIEGRKFHDINGNGTQDGNEPGLGSWKIYIDANENGQWDSGELYNLTDVNGNYALVDLAAGTYTVAEVLQVDWDQTFPGGDGTHTVVLSPGELAENINFGNRIPVAYGGGSGTANDPYLIYTAEQMNAIGADSNDWDKHFRLMADIDIGAYTGTSFNIIGYWVSSIDNASFTGVFDGNGHTISNFTYTSATSTRYYNGLFGIVRGDGAQIKNLGLENANVNLGSGHYVGTLVGRLVVGAVSNCYAEGGSVSSNRYAGGLVGGNDAPIFRCYATSTVSGNVYVGGLVGANHGGGSIEYCYSGGSVVGTSDVGGLVGRKDPGSATSYSYWDIGASGQNESAGGHGRTTADMRVPGTFKRWGCVGGWTIDEGISYPRLLWEGAPGEVIQTENYGGGCGTIEAPYLIGSSEEMNEIGTYPEDWDKHFRLMADIDLSGYTGTAFNIIGNVETKFTGMFDGNAHRILNFTYSSTGTDNIGLMRYVYGPNAEIRDLVLINPNVDGGTGDNVGSLVGLSYGGDIVNCYAEGGGVSGNRSVGGLVGFVNGFMSAAIFNSYCSSNISGNTFVGGLVGYNDGGDVSDCYSTGTVTGVESVGGLVGINRSGGAITNCYAMGDVSEGTWGQTGGLVGRNYNGNIINSHARGSVSGTDYVGGLVGMHSVRSGEEAEVTNCYSTGSVSGDKYVGGLVGINGYYGEPAIISGSFWDTQTSGRSSMCGVGSGCDNGYGKTTAEMQTESTFTSAGWDFVDETDNGIKDIWRLCNEGTEYPQLNWQYPFGDFGCPDGVDGIDLGVLCEEWLLEELSADLWPQGGDGFVNFLDWAIFADGWQITVDYDGLADFAEQWLKEGATTADIAPYGGDGFVNMADFAVLADNWLAGI